MINKLNIYYTVGVNIGTGAACGCWKADKKRSYFEYSDEATARGLELSKLNLPLAQKIRQDFPNHQDRLPGVIADCLPDGWGRLLMDRWFRKQQVPLNQITALDRLTCLGSNAMGAFAFEPEQNLLHENAQDFSLQRLAAESQKIMQEQASDLLNEWLVQQLLQQPHSAQTITAAKP